MKEDMSLSNLGTVALHAAKVPTNVFSSTLICILTLDYPDNFKYQLNHIPAIRCLFCLCTLVAYIENNMDVETASLGAV